MMILNMSMVLVVKKIWMFVMIIWKRIIITKLSIMIIVRIYWPFVM